MIVIIILSVLAIVLVVTPWNRLTPAGRLWAFASALNAVIFFSMPTTPATSPRRPVIGWLLAASAGVSLILLLLGLLRRNWHVTEANSLAWLGPLILGAFPCLFYAFFWIIGPLY